MAKPKSYTVAICVIREYSIEVKAGSIQDAADEVDAMQHYEIEQKGELVDTSVGNAEVQ